MKDLESQFQTQSPMVRVTPHDRNWERIEIKLQAHRSRRKLFTARVFSIAATVLSLIAVSAGLFFYTQWREVQNSLQYSLSIEELDVSTLSTESIYDVQMIRRYYTEISGHN